MIVAKARKQKGIVMKKDPNKVAAVKKAKNNDTTTQLANLHSRKDFKTNQDYNSYKRLIRDGLSIKDAFETIKLFREHQIRVLMGKEE
jgi:hypothetical protein